MSTKQETVGDRIAEEERKVDEAIQQLEDEQRELEAPANLPSWDQIQAGEDLDKRERRRGLLPRLIAAARIKKLELQRERYEAEIKPLEVAQREAHEQLEAATAKRLQALEEENAARFEYGDAFSRIQSREQRIKLVDREIRELRGEAK